MRFFSQKLVYSLLFFSALSPLACKTPPREPLWGSSYDKRSFAGIELSTPPEFICRTKTGGYLCTGAKNTSGESVSFFLEALDPGVDLQQHLTDGKAQSGEQEVFEARQEGSSAYYRAQFAHLDRSYQRYGVFFSYRDKTWHMALGGEESNADTFFEAFVISAAPYVQTLPALF